MALFIAFALCGVFWIWLAGVIGWKALVCVIGILVCLVLLAEPSKG